MAFCANRHAVYSRCKIRKGKDEKSGSSSLKEKGMELTQEQPYVDLLLKKYYDNILDVEHQFGCLTHKNYKKFLAGELNDSPILHKYSRDVFSYFRGFERNQILDFMFGYSVVDINFDELPADDVDLTVSKSDPIMHPNHIKTCDYYPPVDAFDVPVISSRLLTQTPGDVCVYFKDETLTRKYTHVLRKVLYDIGIVSRVIVVDVLLKGPQNHNGYHMVIYGILQSMMLNGISIYVPGFNVRELISSYAGFPISTSIVNKGYYVQWLVCALKDMKRKCLDDNIPFDVKSAKQTLHNFIKMHVKNVIPTDHVMVLGFAFNQYLCNHYRPDVDFCIITKAEYDFLTNDHEVSFGDIIFDDSKIGSIHSVRTPFGSMHSVMMKNNSIRVYYDFIPFDFRRKLDSQLRINIPNSNVYIFKPNRQFPLYKTLFSLPLVKGIDNFSSYTETFEVGSFPTEFAFHDTTMKRMYRAAGAYTSHCYIQSVLDGMSDKGIPLADLFKRDVANVLAHSDVNMPEFYAAANGQEIDMNVDPNLLINGTIYGANPDALPDGVPIKALVLIFDYTFGLYTRKERFIEAVLKMPNWQNLYNGPPANNQQMLDAIANQYHVTDIVGPYADYTLEWYMVNIDRQASVDGREGSEHYVHDTVKYVYRGRINDEAHTIRICVLNNMDHDKLHAYCLYYSKPDVDDDIIYFTMNDKDARYMIKHFPTISSLGGFYPSRIMQHNTAHIHRPLKIYDLRRRDDRGLLRNDELFVPNVRRFYRNLDTMTNYIQVSDAVAQDLKLYHRNQNGENEYFHYIFTSCQFAPKALQLLGDEFAVVQTDSLYLRLLLGEYVPFIEKHYLHIDYRKVNKAAIVSTPYCAIMQKFEGQNHIKKKFGERVNDWWVYQVKCDDDSKLEIDDNIDKHTLTPIFVDTRVVKSYDLYGCAKRPIQAFYRDVVKVYSTNYLSPSIYQSESLMSQTEIYLELAKGMDRIHVDGNVCGRAECLRFDPLMKSIPFINSPLVPLQSDGNIPKFPLYYYAFLSPSYLHGKAIYAYYDNTWPDNVTETVCARQLMFRSGAVCHETVYHAFDMFYKHFSSYFEDAHVLTAKELLEVHKNGAKYRKSYCSIDAIAFLAFSAFIKTEPYPFDFLTKKIKPPRLIMNPGKLVNFFMITYSHLLEECLKKMPYFAKGKNSRETATDLWELWSRLRHPCAIGMDFTQFEHFVSTSVLVASMSIFVHISGMDTSIVKKWVKRLVYMCKMYKLSFLATRISGEFQTSFGNMIIVGAILYYVIVSVQKEHPSSKAYFYSAGDDCMILCNIEDQEYYKTKMAEVVRDFGMIVKTEDVYTEFDRIHFCQQYPVYVSTTDADGNEVKTWWMINDIVRVLDKLAVQPRVPKWTKADLNRWACLGCYIEFMFGSLPELKDLIKNLKSLAPYKFHGTNRPDFRRAFKTSQDWHIIEALGSSHNFRPEYTIINPLRFYSVCGMESWVMKFYSEYFKDWSPYDFIDNHVDVEFTVDAHGNTIFQYGNFDVVKCVHKYQDTRLNNPEYRQEHPTYTAITERWFHKMVTVAGGYCN